MRTQDWVAIGCTAAGIISLVAMLAWFKYDEKRRDAKWEREREKLDEKHRRNMADLDEQYERWTGKKLPPRPPRWS